ncbi:MAG: DNA topoisomerase III [Succinivibrionaceae bacterium]
MKNLYICEKPSQGRDLAKNLHLSNKQEGFITNTTGTISVTWCMGHLLELYLPDDYNDLYKKWDIRNLPIIPDKWKYHIKKNCKKQLDTITKLIKEAELVTIATDYDREGEAIARSIIERAKYNGPIQRLCLTALDDQSIQKALNNIKDGSATINMYYAALSRARADWLVGMNLSRLFTCLAKSSGSQEVISIGRVLTPTVSLVVQRDLEIQNFIPIPYYELFANIEGKDINTNKIVTYKSKWIPNDQLLEKYNGYITDRNVVEKVIENISTTIPVVSKFKNEKSKQNPPLPFDLTSLQQYCNKRFGFSASKTLDIAQALYEKYKATSYPRTDCRYLPKSMHAEAYDTLQNIVNIDNSLASIVSNADYTIQGPCFNTSKITAHHAIIPTNNPKVNINSMTADELKVYQEIRKAYIAQFYPPAEFFNIIIELTASNIREQPPISELFRSKSSVLITPGWKVLYEKEKETTTDENSEKSQFLPICNIGDQHLFKEFFIEDKITTPPAHFTEATLLSAMENVAKYVQEDQWKKKLKETDGLGTPATRAEIINNSISRGYITRSGKYLISTPKSQSLIQALPTDIKSASMTALWEQGLEKIALGTMTMDYFLEHITNWVQHIISTNINSTLNIISNTDDNNQTSAKKYRARSKTTTKKTTRTTKTKKTTPISSRNLNQTEVICPKCGAPMILRKSSRGEFYGCSKFPNCRGILPK